jgi:hypothetical protein
MIISDKSQQPSKWAVYGRYVTGAAVLLILLFLVLRFFVPYLGTGQEGIISCDAEYIRGDVFVSQGYVFKNAQTQSNERAYKGNFSSKTNRNEPTGIQYILRAPTGGDRYRVSVLRYRTGTTGGELVVKGNKDSGFEKREDLASSKDKDGWEMLELSFNVPETGIKTIEIFVYSNANTPIYFDDLKIEKQSSAVNKLNIEPFNPSTFHLEIAEQDMVKIRKKREDALNTGILLADEGDWVNGKIDDGKQKVNIDVRLKGNRLYHLQGDKWSYKIKVDDPYAWQQIKSFSIYNPASKNFLREWVYHQLLRKEGVIASRYDFLRLRLNNRNRGIYAFEESPDIQMATFHKRPEGPVVRFTEDAFWYNVQAQIDEFGQPTKTDNSYINSLDAAEIEPYKSNQVLLSDELKQHFSLAQQLMHQYKFSLEPAENIFDIELMAKFFAIMDVMQAYQSLDWHDQKYYYNPVKSKLEPVGMSGFGLEVKAYKKRPFIGHNLYNPNAKDYNLYMHLFTNEQFITKYCQYLHQYSTKKYISNFLLDVEQEALRRQQFIREEFSDYAYDASDILKNAKNIRAHLMPENNVSIKAKIRNYSNGKVNIKVTNFHGLPVQICGFGTLSTELRDTINNQPLLNTNLSGLPPKYSDVSAKRDVAYLFYKLPGIDSLFHSELSFWNAPEASVPSQELFKNKTIRSNSMYDVRGKLVAFKKGNYNISTDIVIPEGYTVNIPAGTELNFRSGAKFLSKSAIQANGNIEKPVIFRDVNGLLLLDIPSLSTFKNTLFVGSSNLNYNNWWLPGGVTVYNSKIAFDNCSFSFSKAPESLSIMSSDFELVDCNFNENKRNGLVTRFSKGIIKRTRFFANALVGVELLGSVVELDHVKIEQAADNGLSVGEESKVTVNYIEIKDTDIGVVSKDMSRLTIQKIDLENCKRGFAAYQKKPEYGGSKIVVEDYNAKAVKVLHRIELGSTLKIRGKEVKGY